MKKKLFYLLIALLLIMAGFRTFSQSGAKSVIPAAIAQNNLKLFPTGEFEINPGKIYGPEASTQDYSAVAFNGTVYLVVWSDNRSQLNRDIYGARLSADGTLLDPAGFIISHATGTQRNPAVVTNGDIFMVVWEDRRESDISGTDIYGARVSGNGTVLDINGIEISSAADEQTFPALGSAEGNFLALWVDRRSGTNNDIYGSFISGNGVVANPDGLSICNQTGWQNAPDIAFDGSRYLLVWADQRGFSKDIYGTFLKTDGTISHPNGTGIVTLFNNQENPSLTWSGTQFFLAWEEYQASSLPQIHGGRLNASGMLIDVNGIEIAAYDISVCSEPRVSAMDADYLVTFCKGDGDFTTIYSVVGKRISQEGAVLDPDGLAVSPGNCMVNQQPAMAFSGSDVLVTWTDDRNGNLDIYSGRVTPSGNLPDPDGHIVTMGYNGQLFIDMAYDGTNYLAVWCDTRNSLGFDIVGTRISDGGNVLDTDPILISTGGTYNVNPSVSFNGTHYLVAWDKDGDIYGARITKDGTVADPGGFAVYTGEEAQTRPSVASDGEKWMVAWRDFRNSPQTDYYSDIYAAVVNADGSVQHPQGFTVASALQDQTQPELAYASNQYVVVWEDYRAGFLQPDIYGARITPDGTVLDNNGTGILVGDDIVNLPALAFDGTNFLLCYEEYTGTDFNVKAIRIDQSLTKLDAQPIGLSLGPREQFHPAVAWNGEHFMALWMDQSALMVYRISMAKVLPDGTIAETGILSEMPDHLMYPCIVHGPLKQVLTGFSALLETLGDEPANAVRALGLLIGQGQGPGIAENDPGIISRFEVYPNPAADRITIDFELAEKAPVKFVISSVDGKMVRQLFAKQQIKTSAILTFDMSGLPPGMYELRMTAGNSAASEKLVITGN